MNLLLYPFYKFKIIHIGFTSKNTYNRYSIRRKKSFFPRLLMYLVYLAQCLSFGSWIPHQMVISWSYEWMLWSVICLAQVLAVVETSGFLISTVGIRIHLRWTSWVTQWSWRNETSRKYLYFTLLMLIFKNKILKQNLIRKR